MAQARPQLQQPLLSPQGGQRVEMEHIVVLPEPPKPKPKQVKQSTPWCSVKNKHFLIFRRSLVLFCGLAFATWMAAATACSIPGAAGEFAWDWPMSLGCTPEGVSCTNNDHCKAHVWNWSTCFNGKCVDNSPDLHILCKGSCTHVHMATIMDICWVNVLLVVYWFAGEYLIWKYDDGLAADLNQGRRWQKRRNKAEGFDPEALAKSVRHSWQWNDELTGWKERQEKQKKRFTQNVSKRAIMFYGMYTIVVFGLMLLIIAVISPKHHNTPPYPPFSLDYVAWELASFKNLSLDSFYFWIILSQFILEAGLFLGAVATVRWPQPALVRSKDLSIKPKVNWKKGVAEATRLLADEHPGLVEDTCLLIACHESCLTKEAQFTFSNTVRAALKIFPPKAVFVCDNGRTIAPVDRIQEVCEELSLEADSSGTERIQYLYIPEGNKTHAMYWTTEYWIPELVRRKESVDFGYALMIDDDVPLPPDLHVPLHTLERQPDIKAVSYVICAATEANNENQLVALQDAEYKLAGLIKQFQWHFGSTMACHGAIGLWRRDVLGKKILWDHDTVFHGEDLYMGLLLHRMRRNYTIMVSAGAVVPTFAPEDMLTLFRQRVTSWDLCAQRKFMTYLKEMLGGCCNSRTYILKPFLLQEVINILLDWCRVYLMAGLGHRNIASLMLCFLVFYTLLYIEIILFNAVVLRDRPELRMSPMTVLLFPFYRTWCLVFRLYALLRNLIMYSAWTRKYVKISVREQDMHDIPPVPTVPDPDWWTIWHSSDQRDNNEEFHNLVRRLCRNVHIEDVTERERFKLMAEAALMYNKMLRENALLSFPHVLSHMPNRQANEGEMLGRLMETLRIRFYEKLEELIATQFAPFQRRFEKVLTKWSELNMFLFYDTNLQEALYRGSCIEVLKNNRYILQTIDQVVGRTRWPANHDKVKSIKGGLRSLIEYLDEQVEELEDEAGMNHTMADAAGGMAGGPGGVPQQRALHQFQQDVHERIQQVQRILQMKDAAKYPVAREQLGRVRAMTHRIDPNSQWRANVLMECNSLQSRLDSMHGPVAVRVHAQPTAGAAAVAGAPAAPVAPPAGAGYVPPPTNGFHGGPPSRHAHK